MKTAIHWAALALAALVPLSASAHKSFILPSTTVLSDGDDAWVTFDAAVSNDLFHFNHRPLQIGQVVVGTPDGSALAPENAHEGKLRSTFELHLAAPGRPSCTDTRWARPGRRRLSGRSMPTRRCWSAASSPSSTASSRR
jgi:hypothetical protein